MNEGLPSEAELLATLDRDTRAGLEACVVAYGPALLSFLAAVHGSREEAAEVFAQTCEDLTRSISTFRRACSLRSWLYTLAMNASRRHARDPLRRGALALSDAPALVTQVRSTTDSFLRSEWKDRFRALRDELDPVDRALLVLRVDRNLEWEEVAAVLTDEGAPLKPPAVRKRFERIKAKLRGHAQRAGWLDEER